MASKTLNIDFSKNLKSSYSLKGKTGINVLNLGADLSNVVEGISVSGNTLTMTIEEKKIKFKGISNPNGIYFLYDGEYKYIDDENIYTLQNFYNDLFDGDWFGENTSKTKIKGTVFDDIIDASDYTPTEKNEEKMVGVSISAGKGDDVLMGTDYNDKFTGGAGKDTFDFSLGAGKDTITDAKVEDRILIDGANPDDLKFKKNGNNLEIFYDYEKDENGNLILDDENKVVVKNYFKTKEAKRIENLYINDVEIVPEFDDDGNELVDEENDDVLKLKMISTEVMLWIR